MKIRYLLDLLAVVCFLGMIPFGSLTARAADASFESPLITSPLEISPINSPKAPPPSIVQVIESPAVSPVEEPTNSLILESPGINSSDDTSLPGSNVNLVIESPAVDAPVPNDVLANQDAQSVQLEADTSDSTVAETPEDGSNDSTSDQESVSPENYASESTVVETPETRSNGSTSNQEPVLSEDDAPESPAEEAVHQNQESSRTIAQPIPQNKRRVEVPVLVVESPVQEDISVLVVESPVQEDVSMTVVKKLELEELTFQCDASDSTPATIAKVKNTEDLLVIFWSSDFFSVSGYDPQTRCNQVSARFAAYSKENPITYITMGEMNGQSVICLTSKEDGSCGEGISMFDGLLFTLKPTDDSQQILNDLFAILQNETASEPKAIEQ